MKFSDYIVYVDESGDHGLKTIDPNYPVFVLAFCIFHKQRYVEQIVPAIQGFKLKHFGHDQVILHETDIRKDRGDFSILKSKVVFLYWIEKIGCNFLNIIEKGLDLFSCKDGSLIDQTLLGSDTRKEVDRKLVSAGRVVQDKSRFGLHEGQR